MQGNAQMEKDPSSLCAFFNTVKGCRKGSGCKWVHEVVECKYGTTEACRETNCRYAHWRKCASPECSAATLRLQYCKFCWRGQGERKLRKCATEGCPNDTPYSYCGSCFHTRPWQTPANRYSYSFQPSSFPTTTTNPSS